MEARASTDQEAAPLLVGSENGDDHSVNAKSSLWDRFSRGMHEPVSVLTAFLLILCLLLLILASVFAGLFAGAQHRISELQPGETVTVTSVVTETDFPKVTTPGTTEKITTTATATITATTTLHAPVPTNSPLPCLTPECIVVASSIISSLNTSHDPCDSFYNYANGGWLASHPLPIDKPIYGQFNDLATNNKRIIQSILDLPVPKHSNSPDSITLSKLKGLYESCVNEPLLDKIGARPLLEVVQTVKNLLNDDLKSPIYKGPGRNIDVLFGFGIDGDAGLDPDLMTLQFSQGGTGLPSKEYYDDEDVVKAYTEAINAILLAIDEESSPESWVEGAISKAWDLATGDESELVPKDSVWPPWPWPPWNDPKHGDEKPKERAERLAKGVVKFETRLAEAGLDLRLRHTTHQLDRPCCCTHFNRLPELFLYLHTRAFPSRVIVSYPEYPSKLNAIIGSTDYDIIEAYLVARASSNLDPISVPQLQSGRPGEWCLGKVEEALGFAAGRFYVQKAFGGDSRKKAESVITNVISAFKDSLNNVKWMDHESSKAAYEKATAIRIKVGYPTSPNTTSDASIAAYYGAVKISNDEFFENMLSARAVENFRAWLQLGRRRDLGAWEMIPSEVNAYFNPPENSLVFPAGILQPPFFEKDWPLYMQYGAFGSVAAHELTHAFDSSGRLYNQKGKLEEWWTNKTSEQFDERAACYSKQYSEYTVEDGKGGKVHLNGNLTLGENLADSGVIQAYRAWKSASTSDLDFTLPGLNYTHEQLFWISFGRIWATKAKPAFAVSAVQRARTDPHSPGQYRVDGTLSNIPGSQKAFGCKKGTKMNPEKQCTLWQ
ncbi:Peptidase family M13 [Rhizoctonia solani]|uniref:Peptidase family M13 n=1 Tax=Rhizoctonia solani TaxID=456999 RepID=A0A8H7IHD0_9AGAM|nr:Peptidase family M13 [Rhizoctonia solani]